MEERTELGYNTQLVLSKIKLFPVEVFLPPTRGELVFQMKLIILIPPIRELQHQRAVADGKRRGVIIVCKYNKKVTCGLIAPLKTVIDIQVFLLIIILNKCG